VTRVAATLKTPWEYAQELLDLSHEALEDTEAGSIERRYRCWGRPAAPAIGECEQLTVSGMGFGELGTLAATAGGVGKRHVTGRVNLVSFLVTIFRCAATLSNDGRDPTEAAIEGMDEVMFDSVWSIWTKVYDAKYDGTLFGGRCTELFFDGASALETAGGLSGAEIAFRAEIDGIISSGS
jgi:hypothetical protein